MTNKIGLVERSVYKNFCGKNTGWKEVLKMIEEYDYLKKTSARNWPAYSSVSDEKDFVRAINVIQGFLERHMV